MSLADFFAESLTRTIWSSSPCMTRVGMSNFLRSSVKSVSDKGLDAVVGVLQAGLHAPEPELIERALRDLRTRSVRAKELRSEVFVGLRVVLGEAVSEAVEDLDGKSFRKVTTGPLPQAL